MRIKQELLQNSVDWFHGQFQNQVAHPIQGQFPNFPLPTEIHSTLVRSEDLVHSIRKFRVPQDGTIDLPELMKTGWAGQESLYQLFKQVILRYRRWRAAYIEGLTEKTTHPELAATLEGDIKVLDTLTEQDWFQEIETIRLPRVKDYLPVQFIEEATNNKPTFLDRQYDEKFHILQAPQLFLPDLAFFRASCEDRDAPLAVAFVDIDDFKRLNTKYTEPKVDRNLLPRFMQALEAHVFHHGYAYREGGDEYLILVPALSKELSVAFMDELRCKLADLNYPEIEGQTTVSMGLCIVEPDCSLTDREIRERASRGKKFAKENGKNCIAVYDGTSYASEDLRIVNR